MGVGFEVSTDIQNDGRSDFRSGDGSDRKADYGGDLAKDKGIDLNADTDILGGGNIEMAHYSPGEDLNDAGVDAILDNFQEDKWSDLSLEEKKQSMTDLANYTISDIGVENPPEIIFRDDMPDGSYGGYSPDTNTIEINTNMLDDSAEAADTITHEMWHAHQQEVANNPSNPRAAEYQEGFDNYISPEYDFEGYENQMVEAEARDYAQGFKGKLKGAS